MPAHENNSPPSISVVIKNFISVFCRCQFICLLKKLCEIAVAFNAYFTGNHTKLDFPVSKKNFGFFKPIFFKIADIVYPRFFLEKCRKIS